MIHSPTTLFKKQYIINVLQQRILCVREKLKNQ